MRIRRLAIGLGTALGAIVLLAAITIFVLLWQFNPNAYKSRIEASVRDATGLVVRLDGPIGLAWAVRPTLTLSDVVVQNPPGFAAKTLARVERISVRLDLPALIGRRVVVQNLTVQRPQITLERNSAGVPNWRPEPARLAPAQHPAEVAGPRPSTGQPLQFGVHAIRVENLEMRYQDDRTGANYAASVPMVDVTEKAPDAPTRLHARGEANGLRFDLTAQAAPMPAMLGGVRITPLSARLRAVAPDRDLTLVISAPGEDQPVHLTLAGRLKQQPVSVSADFGREGSFLGTAAPLPIRADAQVASTALVARGVIDRPADLSGVDLTLTAVSPDLAHLADLLGIRLPDLQEAKLSTRLRDSGGLRNGFTLSDLHLSSKQENLEGTATVRFGAEPMVTAEIDGPLLDLAALRMAGPHAVPSQPGPPAAAAHPAPATPPLSAGHLIPDTPLPFDMLRRAGADLKLRVDTVRAEGQSFRDLQAAINLHGGVLGAKIHALFQGAAADLDGTVDARGKTPAVAIALNAPSLPSGQVLGALGAPRLIGGTLALAANLHGAGETPHLIAATLTGSASLTMQNGTIATRVIERTLGPALARANPLALVAHGDTTRLHCLVLRAKAANGRVSVDPLLLSSDLVTVSGSGTVDLAAETLDLHLHPAGKIGSVAFSVPVTIAGSLRDPHADIAKGAPASAVLGLLKGLDRTPAAPGCAAATGGASAAADEAGPVIANPGLPRAVDVLRQLFR